MKQGDLISLKPEYKNPRLEPTAFLILDQDRTVPQYSYVVLDRHGSSLRFDGPADDTGFMVFEDE